jgi:uncharacterized peroxidase-related enzyme
MPRIPALADNEANPESAAIFGAIRTKIGMVPNLYRTTGNSPATLSALLGLGEANAKGAFPAKVREAIALAVARVNGCDYCASAHSAIAGNLKVAPAEVAANLNGTSSDARTAAILAFARAVVKDQGHVADADLDAARSAGLTDADIVETIGNVVQNIFTNYLNHVFETEIDVPVVRTQAA